MQDRAVLHLFGCVTAANHVIHYSRHWNPAKEQQATDRAYRIGSTPAIFPTERVEVKQDELAQLLFGNGTI